jgi:ParB family transcriptional regulator, chromosome partitioning protein
MPDNSCSTKAEQGKTMTASRDSSNSIVKKRKKMALGRGLDALIPDVGPLEQSVGGKSQQFYAECEIELIEPNRYQPRRHFSTEELEQLSESIRSQGIIQPLVVRRADVGYELVAGERRLRAAKLAGLQNVPVVVKAVSDAEMLEMSIVENIQRENLNPMEESEAYHRLIDEFGLTQEQAAAKVGKSRSAVANFLRLRQLPEPIKTSITEGQLSMGHARALLGADSAAQQNAAWREIVKKGLSVRQAEALIKRLRLSPTVAPALRSDTTDRHLAFVAEDLSRRFGTRVQIKRRGKKGKLEIEFFSDEDLDRVLALLNEPS